MDLGTKASLGEWAKWERNLNRGLSGQVHARLTGVLVLCISMLSSRVISLANGAVLFEKFKLLNIIQTQILRKY
jgi:hypothetical protein